MPFSLDDDFLYKSIRNDDHDFWRTFCEGIAQDPKAPKELKRAPLRFSKPKKGQFGIRIDGTYEIGEDKLFDEKKKDGFSKHQSCSFASPEKNFYPPVFLHDDKTCSVGVRLDPKDALLQRIFKVDSSTVFARYRGFSSNDQVEKIYQDQLKKYEIFKDLNELVSHKENKIHNEVMARLKWNTKESSQICIFNDNLSSRLLAQIRALDLKNHLEKISSDSKEIEIPKDYEVPISFYIPADDKCKTRNYSKEDQSKDSEQKKLKNPEKSMQLFLNLMKNKFEISEGKEIIDNLNELLKISSKLTYATSDLFFEKIKKILLNLKK